jgi:hypothetical protein
MVDIPVNVAKGVGFVMIVFLYKLGMSITPEPPNNSPPLPRMYGVVIADPPSFRPLGGPYKRHRFTFACPPSCKPAFGGAQQIGKPFGILGTRTVALSGMPVVHQAGENMLQDTRPLKPAARWPFRQFPLGGY